MLFEKISYPDDFPINIKIASFTEYPIHYHQDIEFVMVLKGSIRLKNGYCTYDLKEGDIFTNSGHEVHRLVSADPDNLVAVIQISTHYFSQYFPNLTKTCYRTYSNKGSTEKHDALREKLLHVLLQYMIKGFNYKTECIYMMVDIIKYLDKYFNLFIFEGNIVVNFESGNQVTIDRISRIIGYIYEFHANQITLEDLAEMEHLSTFYLSHIIKNYTGMNFREFLCFARVEWSEIDLLDTDKKISRVARDVGFSTTTYYEKYFKKWFGTDPATYRKVNKPLVISEIRKPQIEIPSSSEVIAHLERTISKLKSQKPGSNLVNTLQFDVSASMSSPSLAYLDYSLDIQVTPDDYEALGSNLISLLRELRPRYVTILLSGSEDRGSGKTKALKNALADNGFDFQVSEDINPVRTLSYGYDSMAYPLFTVSRISRDDKGPIRFRLRDPDIDGTLIKGYPALVTSAGIRKPIFYLAEALSIIKGDLINSGKGYGIIRTGSSEVPGLIILAYSSSEQINNLCVNQATAHNVRTVINDLKDEVDLSVDINLPQGMYTVLKYSLTKTENLFSYLSVMNFPDRVPFIENNPGIVSTDPELDLYVEDVRALFNISFKFKGAGLQLAFIVPKE